MLKRSGPASEGRLPWMQAAQARVPTIADRPRKVGRKGVTRSPRVCREGVTQVLQGCQGGVWQGSKARFCRICGAACYAWAPSRNASPADALIPGEAPGRSPQIWLSAQCEPETSMIDGGPAMNRTSLRSATQ